MKKSIAILLVLILVISSLFFGCSKKEEEPDKNEETTQSQQQENVNTLEQELSKQPLAVLTAEYLKKGEPGNTYDSDIVKASVMNSSEKTVTYAVVAFAAWNDKDEPVAIKTEDKDEGEYVVRISYFDLYTPKGNAFGEDTVLSLYNDASDNISIIKAIPVSCTFEDGTNWVNPLYEDFCEAYEGKNYVAPENGTQQEVTTTEKQTEDEMTTASASQSGEKDETETTGKNNGQTSTGENNNQTSTGGNTAAPQQSYNVYRCKEIFESGTYKMTVVTDKGTENEESFTMAVKNGSISMSTAMEGIEATMLYNASEDITYMMFDSFKVYCDVTEDMMGDDMDMSEMTKDFKIDIPGEITVSQVDFDGKTVTCESFVDGNGVQNNYYFDANGNLVGRDDYKSNGTVSRMVISGFTAQVDDSVFEIPKGYNYVNLSWLMALMG